MLSPSLVVGSDILPLFIHFPIRFVRWLANSFSISSHPHSYNKKANTRDRKVVYLSDLCDILHGLAMMVERIHHNSSWRKEDVSVRQRQSESEGTRSAAIVAKAVGLGVLPLSERM
jgi:hypothetical protein